MSSLNFSSLLIFRVLSQISNYSTQLYSLVIYEVIYCPWTSYLGIKIFTVIVISKEVNCVNKEDEEFGFVQVI